MNMIKVFLISILVIGIISEDCSNLNNEYTCQGNQKEYPEEWDERSFQTPPRNPDDPNYRETYQDMHYLVGYAQLKYSSDRQICTITFVTRVNPEVGEHQIIYKTRFC